MNMLENSAVVFVDVNQRLEKVARNKTIYVTTNKGEYRNFRPDDFHKVLKSSVGVSKLNEYMKTFKTLQWIICDKDRFTNVQRINGKVRRVITVDVQKYQALIDLVEYNDVVGK